MSMEHRHDAYYIHGCSFRQLNCSRRSVNVDKAAVKAVCSCFLYMNTL